MKQVNGMTGAHIGKDAFGFDDEHSDNINGLDKLPQANGGIKATVTQHQCARPNEYDMTAPGERDIQKGPNYAK